MGVMACSRRECENIMCDDYVDEVGYVCCECKDEFIGHMRGKVLPDSLMKYELRKFLSVPFDHTNQFNRDYITATELFDNEY